MIIYGLMKYIEKIPLRYDRMMNVLTLGNHGRSRGAMLSRVRPGMRVLDIGCGTGEFAIECAKKGALVTAVDASPQMLDVFRRKAAPVPAAAGIRIVECGSASVGNALGGEKFDLVTMSMMLGELPALIRKKTISDAAGLLAEGGRIVICDELWPENRVASLFYHLLFWAFLIPNFVLTRTLITPVRGLSGDLAAAGLEIAGSRTIFFGVISILEVARRGACVKP